MRSFRDAELSTELRSRRRNGKFLDARSLDGRVRRLTLVPLDWAELTDTHTHTHTHTASTAQPATDLECCDWQPSSRTTRAMWRVVLCIHSQRAAGLVPQPQRHSVSNARNVGQVVKTFPFASTHTLTLQMLNFHVSPKIGLELVRVRRFWKVNVLLSLCAFRCDFLRHNPRQNARHFASVRLEHLA